MADPEHYVVMDGLESGQKSDYTIQATGRIEMADNTLGGVPVSRDPDAQVSGSSVNGTVWAQADGYRVYGAIKDITIQNPEHVQLYTGKLSGEPQGDECEVTVRAEGVDFLDNQGLGEGAFELSIEHDIHGAQSETTNITVPVDQSAKLGVSIDNFKVQRSGSETKMLTTKVTERDSFLLGRNDYDKATKEIVLNCDEPKTVSQTVSFSGSNAEGTGKVRVNYTVGDLSG